MDDPRTKICSACRVEKSCGEFYRRPERGDALQSRCKTCQNAARWDKGRFRSDEDRQKVNAQNRASYARNKEKHKQRTTERMRQRKLAALEAADVRACQRCGFDGHPCALDFHHRDPGAKKFNVANAVQSPNKYSWDEIVDEIAKCDVICANCHRIEHAATEGWETSR